MNNRRQSESSNNKRGDRAKRRPRNRGYGGRSFGGGNTGNSWKGRNIRRSDESIARSRYVSAPEEVRSENTYSPINNFSDFALDSVLAKNISDQNYKKPTKIQDQAIPHILDGKDILGIASTGSGKTGAFLIPMCHRVLQNNSEKVLIITPTRDLAIQINSEFQKFAKETRLKMVLLIGGAPMRDQIRNLRSGPSFIVATPGRLIDLEKRRHVNLQNFNNVVLDEVDQMLDMGFIADIRMVISKLNQTRQSLFFSATISNKEEAVANSLLNSPIKVQADVQAPLKSIRQDVVEVKTIYHKIEVLYDLLKKEEFSKVLVFSRTKYGADEITDDLRKRGILVDSLHSNKSQNARTRILQNFRLNKINVLIATDVASRGIDIPDVSHVINYDEPATFNDYIHRIGRTGRIGKKGTALTFIVNKRL